MFSFFISFLHRLVKYQRIFLLPSHLDLILIQTLPELMKQPLSSSSFLFNLRFYFLNFQWNHLAAINREFGKQILEDNSIQFSCNEREDNLLVRFSHPYYCMIYYSFFNFYHRTLFDKPSIFLFHDHNFFGVPSVACFLFMKIETNNWSKKSDLHNYNHSFIQQLMVNNFLDWRKQIIILILQLLCL